MFLGLVAGLYYSLITCCLDVKIINECIDFIDFLQAYTCSYSTITACILHVATAYGLCKQIGKK